MVWRTGQQHPVAFMLLSLSASEQNYSQIEKEALLLLKNQNSSDNPVILGIRWLVANLACEMKWSFYQLISRFNFLSFLVVFDKNGQGPLKITSMV